MHMQFLSSPFVGAVLLGLLLGPLSSKASEVSFRNDVMAVLSKAGCNQGTCHGNLNGKGGLKLSLRGEDPAFDFAALTRDQLGRRTNALRPTDSLMLLKATATIPHEGGRRFAADAPEYAILRSWIAAGLPNDVAQAPQVQRIEVTPRAMVLVEPVDHVSLHIQAFLANGKTRDVTRLAVYEPTNQVVIVNPEGEVRKAPELSPGVKETTLLVRYLDKQTIVRLAFVPARPDYRWLPIPEHNEIDRHVFAKLKTLRTLPSALSSDSTFLRRAFLDTLGVLPTAAEARDFLNDSRADKRARLIDHLLDRPEFADFWALKWADLLHNEEKVLDAKGVRVFHGWIRQSIAEGKPLNAMARELVAAQGSTYTNPPANFYRALRDPYARAEAVGQVFLGVRLQCAKCHNHPFDQWKQDDYHSLATFFSRIQYKVLENNRKDNLDKHEFIGEQIIWQDRETEGKNPRTGMAIAPQLLGIQTASLDPAIDRLQVLADWVGSPANSFFARAQANRIWYHLLGRGIVDPIDDFRLTNAPSNPPLLDALSKELVDHHFDLRQLVRTIMNSRTYQLSALPNETNREDETNFSHASVRRLPAEVLLDAYAQVTEVPLRLNGYPSGMRAGQMPGVAQSRDRDRRPSESEMFLRTFGKPERLLTCECERSEDTTLVQAFRTLTGEPLHSMLTAKDNRIGRLIAAGALDDTMLEEFFLATLSRLPTDTERRSILSDLGHAKDRRAAWEDIGWGLLNCKEFLLRQ